MIQVLAVLAVLFVVGGGIALFHIHHHKRRERFASWAQQRNWSFSRDRDAGLAGQFSFLDELNPNGATTNRFGENCLRGPYHGLSALVFDHHLQVESGSDEDGTNYKTEWKSVVAIECAAKQRLLMRRETLFRRAVNVVSNKDIDFESIEFSRKFEVRADRAFAYTVCHPRMIEYLLSKPPESIEISGGWIVSVADGRVDLDEVEARLAHLHQIINLLPAEALH